VVNERLIRKFLLFLIFYIVVIAGISIALISFGGALESRIITYLLVVFLAFITFGPIIHRVLRRSLDLVEPCIWFAFYYFLHFGVRAIYDLIFGSPILGLKLGMKDVELINTALGVSIIGVLSFWIGYRMRLGRVIARTLPVLPKAWNASIVLTVALLCLIFGWSLHIFSIIQEGGLNAWLRADKYEILAQVKGTVYLNILANLSEVGLFIIFILARLRKHLSYWFLFTIFLILELTYRFFSGSRAQFVFVLFGLLTCTYMTSKREHQESMKFSKWVAIGILLAIVLYPLFSVLRGGIGNLSFLLDIYLFLWREPMQIFEIIMGRQHGLDSLCILIERVPEEEPYTLGLEHLLILVSWIPRAFWPEKPTISVGKIFYEKFYPAIFHEGTAVAVTLPGQFYWDLGITGVIIGMFLIGVLWQILFRYLVQPSDNLSNILVVSIMFPTFFVIVEQSVESLLTMHLFQFLVLIFVVFALRGKTLKMEVH
jgi:oligosaccharide repeat unit polymerase